MSRKASSGLLHVLTGFPSRGRANSSPSWVERQSQGFLPRVVFQIENLTNLDQIPSKVKLIALPAEWWSESAPARALALVEES
jgi:kynurenine formamidase